MITLFTDPISYMSTAARLARASSGRPASSTRTLATASRSPVETSITSTMPPRALRLGDLAEQVLLHLVLQRPLDREAQVVARLGRDHLAATGRDRPALLVALADQLARQALELLVVLQLEAGDAVAVGVGAPQHAAADLLRRVEALVLGVLVHALRGRGP